MAAYLGQSVADAQPRFNPNQAYLNMVAAQNSANVQQTFNNQLQQVYSSQYFGSPINPVTFPSFYPSYPANYPAYVPPVVNPYTYANQAANPYGTTAPGYGTNPYLPTDPSMANPYNPYNSDSP